MRSLMSAVGVLAAATAAWAEEPRQVPGETIIIRDHGPGYRQPVPLRYARPAPAYSEESIERDVWTRAWMLLDIDERGVVKQIKWLNRPGYDLEPIALAQAFGTRFEPARDGRGRAQAARIVYPIEWPSYWWLVTREGLTTRLPDDVGAIRCRGDGTLNLSRVHPVYRDCSLPDMSKVVSEPWIPRP